MTWKLFDLCGRLRPRVKVKEEIKMSKWSSKWVFHFCYMILLHVYITVVCLSLSASLSHIYIYDTTQPNLCFILVLTVRIDNKHGYLWFISDLTNPLFPTQLKFRGLSSAEAKHAFFLKIAETSTYDTYKYVTFTLFVMHHLLPPESTNMSSLILL